MVFSDTNFMQDGKGLPDGPVVISPDGIFPSLFREGGSNYVLKFVSHYMFLVSCYSAIISFKLTCEITSRLNILAV